MEADDIKGSAYGKYRLLASLGRGGMAHVYIAEQTGIEGFSKIVALKRVLPHLQGRNDFRRMFFNEAKVVARLEHPNIVSIFELGEADGSYFISLEYLPGEDLGDILETCRRRQVEMPVEFALAIAQQCAGALHFAHELIGPDGKMIGVVHRDVNPSNIMVTFHGVAKVLDFGIAKVRGLQPETRSGFKGKPAYSAPEQSTDSRLIDRRADIFCLGIVLWECLTGRRLFRGDSDAASMEAVRTKTILPPSTLRADIPKELDELVLKALARLPADRYDTALEMSEEIERLFDSHYARVAPAAIGRWLEELVGSERVAAKRQVAQGHNVRAALATLSRLSLQDEPRKHTPSNLSRTGRWTTRHEMRTAWSTDAAGGLAMMTSVSIPPPVALQMARPTGHPSSGATGELSVSVSIPDGTVRELPMAPLIPMPGLEQHPPLGSNHPPDNISSTGMTRYDEAPLTRKSGVLIALSAVGLAAGLFFGLGRAKTTAPPEPAAALGELDVTSDPAGALIFLDGEPSGRTTPAKLSGLPAGRSIELRLDKPGLGQLREVFTLAAGERLVKSFALQPDSGVVKLTNVPEGTTVFIDDVRIDPAQELNLSAGVHAVRVESAKGVILERTVDVRHGEQEIALSAGSN